MQKSTRAFVIHKYQRSAERRETRERSPPQAPYKTPTFEFNNADAVVIVLEHDQTPVRTPRQDLLHLVSRSLRTPRQESRDRVGHERIIARVAWDLRACSWRNRTRPAKPREPCPPIDP